MAKKNSTIIKENFYIVGIQTKINIAKFLWQINLFLEINFSKTKDVEFLNIKTNKTTVFPVFETEKDGVIYKMAVNRTDNEVLIKEHKKFDFFLFIIENKPNIKTILETTSNKITLFKQFEEINEIEIIKIKPNYINLIFGK